MAADLARALARAGDRSERDSTADATTVASRSDGSPVLDPAALDDLRELVGGDPSTLSGLVADFLAETPPLVHELRDAAAGGDPERAHRAAHTLKGLGATFGAMAMARLCQRAETRRLRRGHGGRDRRRARARRARPAPPGRAGLWKATFLQRHCMKVAFLQLREPPPGVWPSLGRRLAAPCSLVCRGQRRPRHPEDPHGRGCPR